MDADERRWGEHLSETSRQLADELRAADDHYHRDLIEDLEALHARLVFQLRKPSEGSEAA